MSVSAKIIVLILIVVLFIIPLAAQDDSVTVPDVSDKTLAEAAAILNQAGLVLGSIDYDAAITADVDDPDYDIIGQSLRAGASVEAGTAVDVTLRYYNVLLRYDGNEFHVINLSNQEILLSNLFFETDSRRYSASRGWGDRLTARNCVQAWSISMSGFYEPQECGIVQGASGVRRDISTNQQFWIDDDVETFRIMQNGIMRGECAIAQDDAEDEPQDTCALWLASNQPPEDITEYLYFVYNSHYFYVHNRSDNQWMPLASIDIEDAPRSLVEIRFFEFTPIINLGFLAPEQCLWITDGTPYAEDAALLTDCDVTVQVNYTRADQFWLNGFTVNGVLDVLASRSCPPVVGDERSVCLVPR